MYRPFLNKNVGDLDTRNITKWVEMSLNNFILRGWKLVDILKIN